MKKETVFLCVLMCCLAHATAQASSAHPVVKQAPIPQTQHREMPGIIGKMVGPVAIEVEPPQIKGMLLPNGTFVPFPGSPQPKQTNRQQANNAAAIAEHIERYRPTR